jgi:medium-chain acyl-[acyl-carrier-protein] hydrolase
MSVGWLCKHAPRPQATARLFCFPSAGVGGSAYRLWAAGLPPSLEVCPVQLPDRRPPAFVPDLRLRWSG